MAKIQHPFTVIRFNFRTRWQPGGWVMAGASAPGHLMGPPMNLVFKANPATGEAGLWHAEWTGHLGRPQWTGGGFEGLARAAFYSTGSEHRGLFYFPGQAALVRRTVDASNDLSEQSERVEIGSTWTSLGTAVSNGQPFMLLYDANTGQALVSNLGTQAPLAQHVQLHTTREDWGTGWMHVSAVDVGRVAGNARTLLVLVDSAGTAEVWDVDPRTLARRSRLATQDLGDGITHVLPCPQQSGVTVLAFRAGSGLANVFQLDPTTGRLGFVDNTHLDTDWTHGFMVTSRGTPPAVYLHLADAHSGRGAIHAVDATGRVQAARVDDPEPAVFSDTALDRLLGPGSMQAEGLWAYWADISRGRFTLAGMEIVPGFITIGQTWEEVKHLGTGGQINASLDAARAAGVTIPEGRSVIILHAWGRGVNARSGHVLGNPFDRSVHYLAHETGHALGLPHAFSDDPTPNEDGSDWPPTGGYDDNWDVMGRWPPNAQNADGLLIGPTLSVDAMDTLGWIDDDDVVVVPQGLPPVNPYVVNSKSLPKPIAPIALRVPLGDDKAWWSIEVQSPNGWDRGMAMSRVFIRHFHTFDDSRGRTERTHKLLRERREFSASRPPRTFAYDGDARAAVTLVGFGLKAATAQVYAARGPSNAQLHQLDGTGRVAGEVWRGAWNGGWTCARSVERAGARALFLLMESGHAADGTNLHFEGHDASGRWTRRLGQARVGEGHSHAVISEVGGALSLLLYSTRSGRVEVRPVRDNLTVEDPVWESRWPAGWTSVEALSGANGAHVLVHAHGARSAREPGLVVHALDAAGVPQEQVYTETGGAGALVRVLTTAEGSFVLRLDTASGEATVRFVHPDMHLGPVLATHALEPGAVDLRAHTDPTSTRFTLLTDAGRLVTWALSANMATAERLSDHGIGTGWTQVCPLRAAQPGVLFVGAS